MPVQNRIGIAQRLGVRVAVRPQQDYPAATVANFRIALTQQGHAETQQVCLPHVLRDVQYAIDAGELGSGRGMLR